MPHQPLQDVLGPARSAWRAAGLHL